MQELCEHLNNYFLVKDGLHYGEWIIKDGILPLDFLQANQYFVITGSVFNDGVYKYGDSLIDETFEGTIGAMAVPPAAVALSLEIKAYNEKDKDSPYTSESFGGYSYSKAVSKSGTAATWQDVFRTRLNKWRKLNIDSRLRKV